MNEPSPWIASETGPEAKKHAPATLRNRDAITEVLRDILPASETVLEIASGSGEHCVAFAQAFPDIAWQPSDPDPECLDSIVAWATEADLPNIKVPLVIDAASSDWPVQFDEVSAILCINMIHISPWAATEGLMSGAGRMLAPGAPLYLYGPYRQAGTPTAESNENFDASLKNRNPGWGLRDLERVTQEAEANGLTLERIQKMPANNLSVIYRKR